MAAPALTLGARPADAERPLGGQFPPAEIKMKVSGEYIGSTDTRRGAVWWRRWRAPAAKSSCARSAAGCKERVQSEGGCQAHEGEGGSPMDSNTDGDKIFASFLQHCRR